MSKAVIEWGDLRVTVEVLCEDFVMEDTDRECLEEMLQRGIIGCGYSEKRK